MSPERRLIMCVFLQAARTTPDWRETNTVGYYKVASMAGIPRNLAGKITLQDVIEAEAQFESLLNKGELYSLVAK